MPGEAPPVCGKSLGEVLDKMVAAAKLPELKARALQWHMANLEYGCATPLANVSLSWWDQDDSQAMDGDHAVVRDGFSKLLDGLATYTEVLTQVRDHVACARDL